MSGINHYPSRSQDKAQRIISTEANIALTASDVGSLYYCFNGSDIYITLSVDEDAKIPLGSQFDFARMNNNVIFASATSPIGYYSSVGSTPKIRVQNAACSFIKVASQEWVIVGDIATS